MKTYPLAAAHPYHRKRLSFQTPDPVVPTWAGRDGMSKTLCPWAGPLECDGSWSISDNIWRVVLLVCRCGNFQPAQAVTLGHLLTDVGFPLLAWSGFCCLRGILGLRP